MQANHILLGRPWQYDDEVKNRYTIVKNGKTIRKSDENCVKKLKKQPNFYAREGKVISAYFTNKPMILFMYRRLI